MVVVNDVYAKQVQLNRSQSLIHLVNANVTYCLWPRGSGKTSGGIGPRLLHLSQVMPRSQCIFYSDTYERIKKTLVPNIMDFFMNEMGLVEDQDFIKYRRPPDHWAKPLIPLDKYEYVISFRTGFTLCLASAEVEGSANGYNAQSAIIDETKFVPEAKIKNELLKALRGALKYFGHLPEYRSHWCFTDKWKGDIRWMQKKKDLAPAELIQAIITKQLKVFDLQAEQQRFPEKSASWYKYEREIFSIETKLNAIRKELVFVSDAKPYENIDILGEKYYRDQERDCESKLEHSVAVLNEDPDTVEHSFYPALSRFRHYYKMMDDTSEEQPLIVAMDYQWRITPMVVAQFGLLPGNEEVTLNIVNSIHTVHPDGGIKKTVKAFCDFYKDRADKTVYFIYDHTATSKRPDGKDFKDIAVEEWTNNFDDATIATHDDWVVVDIYMRKAPDHDIKHEKIKDLMITNKIRFNENRAGHVIKSMQNAGTRSSNGKTQKDKSKEKNLSQDPVEQTDYSDAFDMLAFGVLVQELVSPEQVHFIADMGMR